MKWFSLILLVMCCCLSCRSSRTTQTDTATFHTQQLHYSGELRLNDTLLILPLSTIFPDLCPPISATPSQNILDNQPHRPVNCATGAVIPTAIIRHTQLTTRDTTTTTTRDTTTTTSMNHPTGNAGNSTWFTQHILPCIIATLFTIFVVFVIDKLLRLKS